MPVAGRVRWRAAAVFGAVGSITAFAGSVANRAVDPQVLLLAFAALMVVAAIAMIRRSGEPGEPDDQPDTSNPPATTVDDVSGSAVATITRPTANKTRPAANKVGPAVKVVLAALVVGLLTGFFGVGGGFLIVPALVLALGYSMPVAVGTSLVIISITSGVCFLERVGTTAVPWQIVIPLHARGHRRIVHRKTGQRPGLRKHAHPWVRSADDRRRHPDGRERGAGHLVAVRTAKRFERVTDVTRIAFRVP